MEALTIQQKSTLETEILKRKKKKKNGIECLEMPFLGLGKS